jgi:primosomal protein N' (replication factor Y)
LRLDRDSTSRPGLLEDILQAFERGEADVLVGTQMLSKGHHFPRVTLALVADGDLGLNLPEYNAAERTFQLLLQASGRAGRGGASGQVIIQTRDPSHYCWEYVRNQDYEGFYQHELGLRQKRLYPPFVRLALLRLSFPAGWAEGFALLEKLGTWLRAAGAELGVSALGPAPAPYPLRDRRLRFQCLLKADDWSALRGVYKAVSKQVGASSPLSLALDMDPVSML